MLSALCAGNIIVSGLFAYWGGEFELRTDSTVSCARPAIGILGILISAVSSETYPHYTVDKVRLLTVLYLTFEYVQNDCYIRLDVCSRPQLVEMAYSDFSDGPLRWVHRYDRVFFLSIIHTMPICVISISERTVSGSTY